MAIAHGCPWHQIQGDVFQDFFMVLVAGRLQMAIMTEGCKPDPEKHIPEIKKKHNIIASLHPERANWSFYAFRSTRKDGQRVQRGTNCGSNVTWIAQSHRWKSHMQ